VDSTFDILAEQEGTSTLLFWFDLQLLDWLDCPALITA
jgi:hypothetical protein